MSIRYLPDISASFPETVFSPTKTVQFTLSRKSESPLRRNYNSQDEEQPLSSELAMQNEQMVNNTLRNHFMKKSIIFKYTY